MTAAAYNPDTIKRIRALASHRCDGDIARDLEWDLQRLRSIAKHHEIELRTVPPAASETPDLQADVSRSATGDVAWSLREREVRRGNVALTLTKAQARIFDVLLQAYRANQGPIKGPAIAAAAAVSSPPGFTIGLLEQRLQGARIKIVTSFGRRGGYQLDVLP
jgi:hypothetical protein